MKEGTNGKKVPENAYDCSMLIIMQCYNCELKGDDCLKNRE